MALTLAAKSVDGLDQRAARDALHRHQRSRHLTQLRTREGDPFSDPLDVARECAAGASQVLQARVAPQRFIALGQRAVALCIRSQEAAQNQNASSWGPQFVNNGIAAYHAHWLAGIVHANQTAAEAAHRWNGTCWLHHGCVEIGDDGHRQFLDLRRCHRRPAGTLGDAGVVQSVRTLAPQGFPADTGGRAGGPHATAGLQRPPSVHARPGSRG